MYISPRDLDMQRTRTIWTITKEGSSIRISPAKFSQNSAISLVGDVLWSNCWWNTTHDSRPTTDITIAHQEPMAQMSLNTALYDFENE